MITMDDIVREGNSVLREVAEEVNLPASEEEVDLLERMMQFLKNSQDPEIAEKHQLRSGVGLAAPQLGISKRLVVVHFTDDKEEVHSYKLINPKIVSHSVETTHLDDGEGCLSVDREIAGIVPRYKRITVRAYNEKGEEQSYRLRGFPAIVFQHEIDHLNGIMFYDRIEEFKDPLKRPV
ncbi:peptide deformylase [Salsuginibacillus kocurii]|uniref:peptide deformylase n=1 Tax=Salsuginibacillus kocurii TaxID=427078 RepID=UPI00035F03D6|nr:peptide deformylase [Salsuginibacillus kocurii]